eukprot:scaffold1293_cov139-Skeletonema_menzelii.AAC.2
MSHEHRTQPSGRTEDEEMRLSIAFRREAGASRSLQRSLHRASASATICYHTFAISRIPFFAADLP